MLKWVNNIPITSVVEGCCNSVWLNLLAKQAEQGDQETHSIENINNIYFCWKRYIILYCNYRSLIIPEKIWDDDTEIRQWQSPGLKRETMWGVRSWGLDSDSGPVSSQLITISKLVSLIFSICKMGLMVPYRVFIWFKGNICRITNNDYYLLTPALVHCSLDITAFYIYCT